MRQIIIGQGREEGWLWSPVDKDVGQHVPRPEVHVVFRFCKKTLGMFQKLSGGARFNSFSCKVHKVYRFHFNTATT